MKKQKRSSKNLKITTRITLATILGIVIPLLLVIVFSTVTFTTIASNFNVSTVTTNSYSLINQVQWNQTLTAISNELVSNDIDEEKYDKIDSLLSPLEKLGSMVYIDFNDNEFYSTSNKDDVLKTANEIVSINDEINMNYFSENGIVIVNHAETDNGIYLILIVNEDYAVNDATSHYTNLDINSFVFGNAGLFIIIVVMLFIISMLAVSFITSRTIVKPLNKLAKGANEIASGNLDYVIDYESTNEIGETVNSFNNMTAQLKTAMESERILEESRKELIAGLAHDIRTPLTSAKGYVEGLLDGIAKTPDMQQRYLKTIYSSTCDMEKLTDELLSISRYELGKAQINPTPIKINDFMDDCVDEISLQLKEKGFEFEYINNCDDNAICDIDADKFSRVIQNIISNSIKYAKKDTPGRIEFSLQGYQKSVIIAISDNGIGVDSETLPKIFDSFYRADKARSNVRDGSGIGLTVCKQIVELHNGHIWATGKDGEGLTIHISLQKRLGDNNE